MGVGGDVVWVGVVCVCVYVCDVWEWVEMCMLCGSGGMLKGDITGLGIIITLWECQLRYSHDTE